MTRLHTLFKAAAAFVLAGAALSGANAGANEVRNVSPAQSQAMKNDGALLLDVREPYEFAETHAPGSTLIPLGQLEARLKEIGAYTNKTVVVICRSGQRSARAAALLAKHGFSAVHNVSGGMNAWSAAGLPVVAPGK